MIRLFVENEEVELTENVEILLNKEFEDLTNPTIIINDWSKTINLPFSEHNNLLFGNIFNPDRIAMKNTDNLLEQCQYSYNDYCVYDEDTCTCKITTTNNVSQAYTTTRFTTFDSNHNSISNTAIQTSGRYTYNLNKTSSVYYLRITFTGDHENGYIEYDIHNLTDGDYRFNFYIRNLRINCVDYNNMVLVTGTTAKTWEETHSWTGLYFDPRRKMDFRLELDGNIIMSGYMKMNSITKANGKGTYNITLNAELGKILQLMQKITFDPTKNDADHLYISPAETFNPVRIRKELVDACWRSASPSGSIWPSLKWIGFAPNNSFSENFDHKSYQLPNKDEIKTFANELESVDDNGDYNYPQFMAIGIDADSVVGDGLLPKDIGEWRSYLQLPYVKWNKLFERFLLKVRDNSDYNYYLDPDWFSTGNTYYNDVVMMLKPFDMDGEALTDDSANMTMTHTGGHQYELDFAETDWVEIDTPQGGFTLNISITPTQNPAQQPINFGRWTGIEVKIKDQSDNILTNGLIHNSDTIIPLTGYTEHVGFAGQNVYTTQPLNISATFQPVSTLDRKVFIKLKPISTNLTEESALFYYPQSSETYYWFRDWNDANVDIGIVKSVKTHRSNTLFTFNDLWDNDVLPYDCILNYCKMFRILIIIDELNKKIKFVPACKYFQDYTITDWTDKLDTSRDYVLITPTSFENKYVLFNYKNNETKLGKEYLNDYGFDYGELNLITDYNFNTETVNLFDKEWNTSIVYSDNNLSWNDIISGRIRYVLTNDILTYNRDDKKKGKPLFGSFMLFRGIKSFDTNPNFNFRTQYISDDTNFMFQNNTYCYSQQSGQMIQTNTYPWLDVISANGDMILFNKPKKNYTSGTNYDSAQGVYDNFWKKYIEERYNKNNKKVSCYLNLTKSDWMGFDYNHFVKIDNQLFIVNKIYDFNPQGNTPTKVDLITIGDITAYTTV